MTSEIAHGKILLAMMIDLSAPDLTDSQRAIQEAVDLGMEKFPLSYWRKADAEGRFPHDFFAFAAQQGWLGLTIPEEFGGAGLGISEAAVMLEAVARSGAGLSGTSAIHMNVFGMNVVVKHGTPALKESTLPKVAKGELKLAFGVTEPDAGLDTSSISTKARWERGKWHISGKKVWISTAQVADKLLLLTRTSPRDPRNATDGLTLFLTEMDRDQIGVVEIDKVGRSAVDSNELFIDDLVVDDSARVGEVGQGFRLLLDGLNPERLLVAAEAIGIGRAALELAASYARDRVVFGRPIGMNQGVQFPLAEIFAHLEAAWLVVMRGSRRYDRGEPSGIDANIAKLMGGEYGFKAADQAMQTLGGFGYSKEYHVERLWREAKLCRIAPVSPELILSFIGERALGLPKSY